MQLIYQSMERFGSTIGYKILQHFHYSDLWPSSSPEPGRSRGPAAPRGARAAPVYRPPPNANGQTPETGSHELPWSKAIPPLGPLAPGKAGGAGPAFPVSSPGLAGAGSAAGLPHRGRLPSPTPCSRGGHPAFRGRPPRAPSGQGRGEPGPGRGGRDYSSRRAARRGPSHRPA